MNKETSEITKLTERISKDPKSKLFVPLAEEYKKTGDIEMAVHVLLEGLKHNPGYVTAKSFLGRLLLEKGDYPGAQKEFEEVVKAIPDNLLAQRKLGDLYALQNKQAEALKHYKIVLAQNPGDEDFASLVSDVESGVDVRPRLLRPKTKLSPEPSKMPEKKPVSPQRGQTIASSPPAPPEVATTPETAAVSSAESQPGPEPLPLPPFEPEEEPAGTAAEAGPAEPEKPSGSLESAIGLSSPSGQLEPEEPEEVLAVEPLEEEQPVEEVPSQGLDFFAETTEGRAPAAAKEEQTGEATAGHEPQREEPFIFIETETMPSITADIAAAPFEATPAIQETGPAGGQTIDQADDFTTDTLAELYIAQGFFEKAIDIYQRMLADHPNSRGLADKLERVKTMAAAAEAPAESEGTAIEAFRETAEPAIPAEAKEYLPSLAGEREEEAAAEAELPAESEELRPGTRQEGEAESIFTESREYSPAEETVPVDEPSAIMEDLTVDKKAYDIFMPPPQETAREKPLHAEFEPREYVPPDAGPHREKKEKMHAAPKPQAATRKETIDRLENWLKNIVKEK